MSMAFTGVGGPGTARGAGRRAPVGRCVVVGGGTRGFARQLPRTLVSSAGAADGLKHSPEGKNFETATLRKEQNSAIEGFAAVPGAMYPAKPAREEFQLVAGKPQGARCEALTVPTGMRAEECVQFFRQLRAFDNQAQEEHAGARTVPIFEKFFVVDRSTRVLVGTVAMVDLLLADHNTPIENLSRDSVLVLHVDEDLEVVVRKLRAAEALIAPVVNDDRQIVGVVTANDIIWELELEASDELLRFGGVGGDEATAESYFASGVRKLFMGRVSWLVGLLMLQSLSSIVLGQYQSLIESNVVLALFLTMLTGTGGNAGNQSSALVIRGLATGEIRRENYARVIGKEALVGFSLALVVAIASFCRVYVTAGSTLMSAFAVSIAVLATTFLAVLGGTVAPMILQWFGIDPCNCASPVLATMTDVSGVLILCAVGSLMLR